MLVYLCGPIDMREKEHTWKAKAEKKLNAANFNVYNPEAAFSFYYQEGVVTSIELRKYSEDCNKLADINTFALKLSDVILANITGCPTVGTYTELYEARIYNKCVYAVVNSGLYRKSIMLRALLKGKFVYTNLEMLLTHLCYISKDKVIKGSDALVR